MVRKWLDQLAHRNRLLYRFGWLNLVLLGLGMILFFVDDTRIMGINAWIKPMKFAISIAIYSWTFAWMVGYIENQKVVRRIAFWLVVTMTAEILLIYLQAWRGTTSHYNITSVFNGIVFQLMGIFIFINTLLNLYAFWIFIRGKVTIAGVELFAWRAALFIFCTGSLSGGWMIRQMAHTIGAPDGGPGIPFFNWSTIAGDIRIAHFITLHSLQVIPILTYFILQRTTTRHAMLVNLVIFGYGAISIFLHVQAWMGLPLLRF